MESDSEFQEEPNIDEETSPPRTENKVQLHRVLESKISNDGDSNDSGNLQDGNIGCRVLSFETQYGQNQSEKK